MGGAVLPKTCGGPPPVVWLRPGHAGYLGPNIRVEHHTAAVDVLNVGVDGPLLFDAPDLAPVRLRSVFAPARVPHRVLIPEGRVLLLFADPGGPVASGTADAMAGRLGRFGFGHRSEAEIAAACRAGEPPEAIARHAAVGVDVPADPRITRLADTIRSAPDGVYRAHDVAAELGLSTSHFLRLFARGTGTTFRRYQQWARLRRVVRGLAAGHDLTRSAVEAGFASPSHFSDTFRHTFGLSATDLLHTGVRFDIADPAAEFA
ncbi:helix-turn-helix transcriptional regulator [Nocardia blacklockiae]|uniref:helix-turn-helix transcriptional regulator n=1 Tax=Nocardia blacklockiae TaxID=480036 RepID=UPI001894F2A4|nr:AraC family transcriptional regulator [Nocardia blacklockiae]MBF6171007.1 helix-turn-helix transcriptional regulator [Nocardia blacklockiae]